MQGHSDTHHKHTGSRNDRMVGVCDEDRGEEGRPKAQDTPPPERQRERQTHTHTHTHIHTQSERERVSNHGGISISMFFIHIYMYYITCSVCVSLFYVNDIGSTESRVRPARIARGGSTGVDD